MLQYQYGLGVDVNSPFIADHYLPPQKLYLSIPILAKVLISKAFLFFQQPFYQQQARRIDSIT